MTDLKEQFQAFSSKLQAVRTVASSQLPVKSNRKIEPGITCRRIACFGRSEAQLQACAQI